MIEPIDYGKMINDAIEADGKVIQEVKELNEKIEDIRLSAQPYMDRLHEIGVHYGGIPKSNLKTVIDKIRNDYSGIVEL